jgi:CHAD domain-containing protein
MDQRFAVLGVEAFTPLAEAAPALLLAKAEPLFELEADARGGADMDAVHDMRVASRRLRETMRLLEPLYPMPEYRAWYKRVTGVTRALGPVRDSDVFIDDFSRLAKRLGEGGRRMVAFLVGYRMGVRERQLVVLNRQLAKLDLAKSRKSLRKVAHSVGASSQAKRSLADFAHAAVAERMGIVFGALPAALVEENMLQQHALRIDFKRLRYAVEVFAPVYGDDFDELHDTLTAFQDTLGDLHDLHLFLDMLVEPERTQAAAKAGVSAADVAEVVALLELRAKETFDAFVTLAAEHPASELLPALLLPLSRRPEPLASVEPAPAVAAVSDDESAVGAQREAAEDGAGAREAAGEAEAVAEGLADAQAEPVTAAAVAPAAAVVLQAPAPVVPGGVPQLDPAKPWNSDAAGLSIDPPVVIGAEPWARVPARAPEPQPAAAATPERTAMPAAALEPQAAMAPTAAAAPPAAEEAS